jgi:hypothetical protein
MISEQRIEIAKKGAAAAKFRQHHNVCLLRLRKNTEVFCRIINIPSEIGIIIIIIIIIGSTALCRLFIF